MFVTALTGGRACGYDSGMERQLSSNARISHRLRGLLATLAVLAAAGVLAVAGINIYVVGSARDRILTVEQAAALDADCILVLGAGLQDDGSPSAILADRLDCALALYESGASDRLLMSGDHSRVDYDEVGAMKAYAVEHGAEPEEVFLDHAGFSTYESVYRARDVFEAETVIIVTQRYHLYRALYLAERLGLTAYGVASDARSYARQPLYSLREVFARCKDFLFALYEPEPTYLGRPTPVSGNGNLTDALPPMPLA